MADKLDPAVQIRIIDLAEKISQSARTYKTINDAINGKAELFGIAYNKLIKAIEPQP
jgi:hypothetical protein